MVTVRRGPDSKIVCKFAFTPGKTTWEQLTQRARETYGLPDVPTRIVCDYGDGRTEVMEAERVIPPDAQYCAHIWLSASTR